MWKQGAIDMKRPSHLSKRSLSALAVSSVLAGLLPGTSNAQTVGQASIAVQKPAQNPTYTLTEDALVGPWWGKRDTDSPYRLFLQGNYQWMNEPFVRLNNAGTARTGDIINNLHSLFINVAAVKLDHWQIGASTEVHYINFSSPDRSDGTTFGDTRVYFKYRLTDLASPVAVAIMPEVFIPSGDNTAFLSDGWGVGTKAIMEAYLGSSVLVSANVGIRYSPDASIQLVGAAPASDRRVVIPLGLGTAFLLNDQWSINLEGNLESALPMSSELLPSVLYAGVKFHPTDSLTLSAGGGLGSFNGYSSSDYRVIAGLTFIPQPAAKPVVVATAPIIAPIAPVVVEAPKVVVKKKRVFFTPKKINITEEIKFKHNRAELTSSGEDLLNEVAKVVKEHRRSINKLVIEGHANELGTMEYNQRLSERRAAAVVEYLESRGIDGKILSSIGFGETRPKKIKGLSRTAKLAADRRVDFMVRK